MTTPDGTIVPFSTLPACAALCGPLFDAQGACSPPVQAVSTNCFCAYGKLQPFYQTTANVCDGACPNDPNGLANIQTWFKGLCARAPTVAPTPATATGTPTGTATGTRPPSTNTGAASGDSAAGGGASGGGTWIASHWQYIIMIVVVLIGLALLGVGLAMFRKHRARKRELQYEMRPPVAPWVQGQKGMSPYAYNDGIMESNKEGAGMMPMEPKQSKARWIVKERT